VNIAIILRKFYSSSGIDNATTDMEKVITVPSGIPFTTNTCMIGNRIDTFAAY
jgi:hypothetical protein